MNAVRIENNRQVIGKGSRLHFLLLFIVMCAVIYPYSETLAQSRYPDYVMHTHSTSQMADNLYDKGMSLFNARKFNNSATYLSRAFKMYDTMGDSGNRLLALTQMTSAYAITRNVDMAKRYVMLIPEALDDTTGVGEKRAIYCTYALANIYEQIGEYNKGMQFIQKATRLYRSLNLDDKWLIGRIYFLNGALEDDFAFYDRAIDYTKRSLAIAKDQDSEMLMILLVDSYNSLGIFSFSEGKYDLATDYLKKEIEILKSHPEWKINSEKLKSSYINMGNNLLFKGDFQTSLSYYQKALRMVREGVSENVSDEDLLLNNIGAVYSQMGDQKNALQYFLKSLPLKIKIFGPEHPNVAIAYVNIGQTYQALKKSDKAIGYLQKALVIREKVFGRNNPKTLNVYNDLASVYKDQKKYDKALQYLEHDLSVNLVTPGLHHPETAMSYQGIADVYKAMGNYNKALEYYQHALQALAPNFHSSEISDNPKLDHILSEVTFETILESKAKTLLDAAIADDSKAGTYIPVAIKTYKAITQFIERLRSSYQAESSKYLLNTDTYPVYSGAIAACMFGYHLFGNESYRKEAFNFSEKSKAGILMQSIADARAQRYSRIPDSLLERESKLRQAIQKYSRDVDRVNSRGNQDDTMDTGALQDKLFAARQRLSDFISGLERMYPEYYELKYQTPYLSVSDIQKKLSSKQVYLSYFVGDSTLYTFDITKGGYNVVASPIDSASFLKKLADFRHSIIKSDWTEFTKNGYQLYQKIVEPVQDNIQGKDLMIVPDAELSLVPFEALLTKTPRNTQMGDFSGLPYLIRKHAITYGYSSYLVFRKRSKEVVQTSGLLGMAPVFDQSVDTLSMYRKLTNRPKIPPLVASAEEVNGIYNEISMNARMKSDSHIYLRNQATESQLNCPEISHYRYIHLATHAYVNEKMPSLSGILFYPGNTDSSNNDGILYTGEIYNLNLNARLVVLSACETAFGQLVRGEGIIGFTRAFLYAGARNVVVSLWNVSDRSTPDFMIKFYHYLMTKSDVARSLQQTKIDMINEKRYAMPVYWASMVQIR